MPSSAATIAALTLAAISIGFNTVRYPVVWQMIGPAKMSEPAPVAAASKPEKADSPPVVPPKKAAAPPAKPAKPIEVKPAEKVAEQVTVSKVVAAETKPAGGDKAVAAAPGASKPLVPVAAVSPSGAEGKGAAGGAGIRRLPPVEKADSDAAKANLAQSLGGSIPVYPTTGIE